MNNSFISATAFIVYAVILATIGLLAYRRTRDVSAFILGGRQLSFSVTALSAGASDMSAWLLLGLPGLAYVSVYESIWVALGLLVGAYLNWLYVARPLREHSERLGNALTIPEYFERRFDDKTHILRIVSSICILAFFVFYTAAGFIAGGKLFAATFGFSYLNSVILGASLIVIYTSFGGFLAVVWTDALQAVLMLVALVTVAAVAIVDGGATTIRLGLLDRTSTSNEAMAISNIVVASSLAWGLGYCGQPHILARFMAIKRSGQLRAARRLATAWSGLALACAIAVGFSARYVLDGSIGNDDSEKVFIYLIQLLLHPAVAGVCLAAILAAIMSTADSQILVASTALTHDLLAKITPAHVRKLSWHRLAVIFICLLAMTLALDPSALVLDMVAYAWAGFGATIGPCVLMSLYSPRMSMVSALSGIVVGAMVVVGWDRLAGGVFEIYALLPGFTSSLIVIAVTTKAFPRSPRLA